MCGCVTLSTWSRASLAQSQEEMVSDIHISAQDAQDHGSHFINLTLNHVREEVGATAMHSPRHRKIRAQSECDHPLPHSRFNSHRTRLEDPISSDIEPGTQWNGTPGRPNHPHCSALLQRANEAPPPPASRWSRWSISSSPFSRWDYLLGSRPYGWINAATVAFLTSGCRMLHFPWCQLPATLKCRGRDEWRDFKATWMAQIEWISNWKSIRFFLVLRYPK